MNSKQIHGNIDFDSNKCYFQIIQSNRLNNKMTICEMQWFDEYDYDQSKFCKNSIGDVHCFETENMAMVKLNEWFEPTEIDDKYINTVNSLIRE